MFIGIDVGTSGTKTVLCNVKGKIIAEATFEYPCYSPHPGWNEQNPADWWTATVKSIKAVLRKASVKKNHRAEALKVKGFNLVEEMKTMCPETMLVELSVYMPLESVRALSAYLDAYLHKSVSPDDAISVLKDSTTLGRQKKHPLIFIVHGHDETLKLSLKNFLQNMLKLGEPIILHEQPSRGRTIIEKFEEISRNVDVVFVLLTPDDISSKAEDADKANLRARQNVILELGFFLGKLQRMSGRVILLHKGNIELPSDISGITYIDISGGIDAVGEELRRELREWLE